MGRGDGVGVVRVFLRGVVASGRSRARGPRVVTPRVAVAAWTRVIHPCGPHDVERSSASVIWTRTFELVLEIKK